MVPLVHRRAGWRAAIVTQPLPATAVAHELFTALLAAGRGEMDHSAVITVIEDLTKIEARTSRA